MTFSLNLFCLIKLFDWLNAAVWEYTSVISSSLVPGITNKLWSTDIKCSATIFNLENNLPELRISANVDHSFSDVLALMVRINHYGETIDERSDKEEVDPAQLLDIELTYKISSNMEVVLGGNNILNTYPTEIETRLSQGMPYLRRTPIGYHGGMIYLLGSIIIFNFIIDLKYL